MDRAFGEAGVGQAGARPSSGQRLGRRALGRAAVAICIGALLSADRPLARPGRPLPIAVDDDSARYLHALTDIPTHEWSLLAVTAAVLDPGTNAARGLFGRLPAGNLRGSAL